MRLRRHGKANRIYLTKKFAPISSPIHVALSGDRFRRLIIEITHAKKIRHTFGSEHRMNACVLPAQMAHTDDCRVQH